MGRARFCNSVCNEGSFIYFNKKGVATAVTTPQFQPLLLSLEVSHALQVYKVSRAIGAGITKKLSTFKE